MKSKTNFFYILTAVVFILIVAGFLIYGLYALKTSSIIRYIKPSAYKSLFATQLASKKIKKAQIFFKPIINKNNKKKISVNTSKFPMCKDKNVFTCSVKYLHYLHYLPIYPAGKKYKFTFRAPKILQKIADSYAWNYQNPFILGAIDQYLKASGKLHDGEYARPFINIKLLSQLKKGVVKKKFNTRPWKWVLVKQAKKGEKVYLYENGKKIYETPANTGVMNTTPDGTWYVFLRVHKTSMDGRFPKKISKKLYKKLKLRHPKMVGCLNGHPVKYIEYNDSDIKYVDYFNDNSALHYMPRAHYGFPQSAGCVELPKHSAKFIFKHINYGTIISIIGSTRTPTKTIPYIDTPVITKKASAKKKPQKLSLVKS